MFDSRTDAPHKGVHALRSYRKEFNGDVGDYAMVAKPAMTAEEAIAEGLQDMEEVETFDYQGLKRLTRNLVVPMPDPWADEPIHYTSERKARSAKRPKEAKMFDPLVIDRTRTEEGKEVAPRKPRVSRHPWRTKAEAFDPTKVSRTLSPMIAANIQADQPAKTTVKANH